MTYIIYLVTGYNIIQFLATGALTLTLRPTPYRDFEVVMSSEIL